MTRFRVWAPRARSVKLDFKTGEIDMNDAGNGWFEVEVDLGGMDMDYAFSLDGRPAVPDPRSPYQPHGVLGASRTVDHSRFQWTDQGFCSKPLSSALFYEIHIGTFTPGGTFESAIVKLDHLADLGVTHIELMPVCEFPGKRGWGYDGVDLFAPHHHYGGPEGLKKLVNACHQRGIAVAIDVVFNHVGPTGNYLDQFGPYFMEEHPGRWGQPFNFGQAHSDEVRRFFIDNMRMWMRDYHIDALRLDAIHVMIDYSAYHILEELSSEADQLEAHLGRPLFLIAESDLNDPRIVRPTEVGGLGLDAQWLDDFHHALHAYLTGQNTGYFQGYGHLSALAKTLREGFYFAGEYCPHRDRCHGRPATGLTAHRFIGFLQNHDQIGNRYAGDRSAHFLTPGQARIAAAVVLTSPYIPMLFMGEEWAASTPFLYFTDHEDPELARAVSIGRQKDFEKIGWDPHKVPDPQDPETMEKSKLIWEEIELSPHREMLDWHKQLIALRRKYPELTDGRLERIHVEYDDLAQWLVFWRGDVYTLINFAKEARHLPLKWKMPRNIAAASEAHIVLHDEWLEMPPESVAIMGP